LLLFFKKAGLILPRMEIHPPEHPIRTIRDFASHILTITCGIVIALSLEGLVAHQRDATLARQTRAAFIAELDDNLAKVKAVRAMADSNEAWLVDTIALAQARLSHGTANAPKPPGVRRFPAMGDAAWQTALATQALPLLTFPETRALAAAYSHQAVTNDLETRAREQWIALAAFDPTAITDAEAREALRQLRIALAYQGSLDGIQDQLMQEYEAAKQALTVQ
jgi:hypothetical protein